MNDENIFNFEEVEERERSPHLIPWIVTGALAVIAILVSLIVMNLAGAQGGDDNTDKPEVTEPVKPEPVKPDPQPKPDPKPEEPEEPEVDPNRPDDAIDTADVSVGTTFSLDVEHEGWHMNTEVPNKFGMEWRYKLEDGNRYLVLQYSSLIDSLPESCSAQRGQWGLERMEDGSFKAYSPQQMCTENEALYTELLGLVRHMEETAKPLS